MASVAVKGLIVRDKVTRQMSTNHDPFDLQRKDSRSGIEPAVFSTHCIDTGLKKCKEDLVDGSSVGQTGTGI